jgi:cytochrome c oxidase subunit 2
MRISRRLSGKFFGLVTAALAFVVAGSGIALADGIPQPWQWNFQPPATEIKADIVWMHEFLMYIVTAITIFVVGLLAYVCIRFSAKNNPVPDKFTHNVKIEVIWTVIPALILIVIGVPSVKLLYKEHHIPEAAMTLKVKGHQWYWSYEYPDHGNIAFDSYMIADEDIKPGQIRLLEVDNRVVVPAGKVVRVQLTGADVIHSWAVPALGVKKDTMPGRLNETWFKIEKPGVYYGQCSELCGVKHGFMPIVVEAVSEEDFEKWIDSAKEKFASDESAEPEFQTASSKPE